MNQSHNKKKVLSTAMEGKWEGEATSAKLHGIAPNRAWVHVGDYYNIHKYFPSVVISCGKVTDRDDGRPGSFRHTALKLPGKPQSHWAKDQLVAMDAEEMSYTFELKENSMGFGQMVVTLKVLGDGDGCRIKVAYHGEPAKGWTHAEFVTLVRGGVEEIAKKVEGAVLQE